MGIEVGTSSLTWGIVRCHGRVREGIYSITKRRQLVPRRGQASRSASGLRHQ